MKKKNIAKAVPMMSEEINTLNVEEFDNSRMAIATKTEDQIKAMVSNTSIARMTGELMMELNNSRVNTPDPEVRSMDVVGVRMKIKRIFTAFSKTKGT